MKLTVNFFGKPRLFLDGTEMFIPPKKLLAVFLYLVYQKSCNRDDMVSKFWCGHSEAGAKQNLRNSIYNIKQYLGRDIIVTKGNSYIQISPEIEIERDIDIFISDNNAKALLELQELVFMDNLNLSRCEEFEQWKGEIQSTYGAIFSSRLEAELQTSLRLGDLEYAEKFAEKLVLLDSYHEAAVRALMGIYLEQGLYAKAVKQFGALEKRLQKDLGIQPERETQELCQKVLETQRAKENSSDQGGFFYGRIHESVALGREYEKYLHGDPYRHCILSGALGCGKTRLIHAFVSSKQITDLVDLEFEIATKSTAYYAIHKIVTGFFQLLHYRPSKSADSEAPGAYYAWAMDYVLEQIAKFNRKVVLVVKNIEAIDQESLQILAPYFLERFYKSIFFVGEYCPNFHGENSLLSMQLLLPGMLVLPVQCLSERETADFLDRMGEGRALPQLPAREIYALTQGNLRFLQDIVAQCRAGQAPLLDVQEETRNKIRLFLLSLSTQERRLIEILSLFENGVTADMAAQLVGMPLVDTLELLNALVNREVAEQTDFHHRVLLRIRTKIIQNVVYADLQEFKKVRLHEMAAQLYELDFPNNAKDYFCVSELKYHYTLSGDPYKGLYFTLVHMEYILDYCDQFFPTLRPLAGDQINFYIDRDEIYQVFDDCEKKIYALEDSHSPAELCELKMKFAFLMGRALHRDGKREQGILYIRELTKMAKKLNREDYLLKAYLETTYYGLRSDNPALMEQSLEKASKIQSLPQYEIEQGIIYRLWGLVHIFKKEYELAEQWLWKSIHLFESPGIYNQNFMNIAAAYAYMGYCYRNKADYHSAQEYFLKAIGICEDKGIRKSLDLFYEDLGYIHYLKGEYDQAEECFNKSSRLYDEFGTYWLRSIGESCLVMINLHKGDYKKAMEHYHRAEIFSRKDSVKEEMAVLQEAREQIRLFKLM